MEEKESESFLVSWVCLDNIYSAKPQSQINVIFPRGTSSSEECHPSPSRRSSYTSCTGEEVRRLLPEVAMGFLVGLPDSGCVIKFEFQVNDE